MSKVAIVYYSSTGNTKAMALGVAEGVKEAGGEAKVIECGNFGEDQVSEYDGFALGCPAMGDESLDDTEFQPMYDSIKGSLSGKKVALFGSYGWGDGEWMRSWEERCAQKGITLAAESVICNEAPDDDALEACKKLGAAIA